MNKRVIQRNMFFGAKKNIFLKAVELRENMTEAELLLWRELSNREIFKVKFRRQHPIDIFIVDFYCHKCKLAIEVDGGIHLERKVREHDDGRTHDLESFGIKVLRFSNREIIEEIEMVKFKIRHEISILSPL